MNAPALLAEGISHRYGDVIALHPLGFSLPVGTRCALIGPDGAGKSTLLGLIAGVKRLQQGELQVLGGSIRQRRHRTALYPKVAFMPQGLGNNLYPELSISENIRFLPPCSGWAAVSVNSAWPICCRPPTCSALPSARPASCREA